MRQTIIIPALCALLLAACGGSGRSTDEEPVPAKTVAPKATATAATATTLASGGCTGAVKLDSNGNYANATAEFETVKRTDCATARKVMREWGSQNVGGPDAKLPAGWKCDEACTSDFGAKVTFALNLG